ncbi:unnamed protein product [Rodentolepis nana]|uniref:Ovule protein n=1 Tax=Rodentolepis nana TaxID=102285 RepID=A0A0R3T3G8_RODNA|nr:unnamed protein product [Rodentolepis nana]
MVVEKRTIGAVITSYNAHSPLERVQFLLLFYLCYSKWITTVSWGFEEKSQLFVYMLVISLCCSVASEKGVSFMVKLKESEVNETFLGYLQETEMLSSTAG